MKLSHFLSFNLRFVYKFLSNLREFYKGIKTVNFKTGSDLNRTALEKILQKYTIIKQRIDNEN